MIFLQVCFISLFDLVREVFIRWCGLRNWKGAFYFCNSFSTAFTICFQGRCYWYKMMYLVYCHFANCHTRIKCFTTDFAWCSIVISCFIAAVSNIIPPSSVSNVLSRLRVYIWLNFEPVNFLFRCLNHFSELVWFLVCLHILSICGCTIFNCSVNIPTFLKFERLLSQANVSETSNILRGRYMYSLTLQLFFFYILFILQNDSLKHAVSQFHKACCKCYQNFVS